MLDAPPPTPRTPTRPRRSGRRTAGGGRRDWVPGIRRREARYGNPNTSRGASSTEIPALYRDFNRTRALEWWSDPVAVNDGLKIGLSLTVSSGMSNGGSMNENRRRQTKRIVRGLGKLNWGKRAGAVLALCAAAATGLPAQTLTTLFTFDGTDGGYPVAALE